jgi:hypothetical protein
MTGRRGAISATELMAELEADPEWVRTRDADEAESRVRAQALRIAEQPIVADLAAHGIEVGSAWDLIRFNRSAPYPAALPILIRHMQLGGYPDRIMAGLARALAVKSAAPWWSELRRLYLNATGPGEEEGLAVALAASATKENLDALIELAGDHSRSDTRILLLRRIKQLGGTRGLEVLESLKSDPMLGKEATALLKVRKRR